MLSSRDSLYNILSSNVQNKSILEQRLKFHSSGRTICSRGKIVVAVLPHKDSEIHGKIADIASDPTMKNDLAWFSARRELFPDYPQVQQPEPGAWSKSQGRTALCLERQPENKCIKKS
mmetsp:Transcript_16846/g.34845  ORF Transcript_16846/g.34845 Transcript_16846/m.34845 type:complete len:118 (-) Transcript_16846:202-555(-)